MMFELDIVILRFAVQTAGLFLQVTAIKTARENLGLVLFGYINGFCRVTNYNGFIE